MGLDNPIHLALLLMIMLLVFGAKRLPEMGRSLGDGLRGFKEAVNPQAPTPVSTEAPVPTAAHVLAASAAPATVEEPVSSHADRAPAV
jgi:sec-independent protein translocase protein TatA